MTIFRYKARTAAGTEVQGVLQARTQRYALEELYRRGYFPISVTMGDERSSSRIRKLKRFWGRRREIALCFRQLADLMEGGLTVSQAVEVIIKQPEHEGLRAQFNDIVDHIRNGGSLSGGMKRHAELFSDSEIGIISAGEASGRLQECLARLAVFEEQQLSIQSQITTAMAYPLFLLVISFIAVSILLLFVLPNLIGLFETMGQTLPWPTRSLIFVVDGVTTYGPFIILLILMGIVLIGPRKIVRQSKVYLRRSMLHVPVIRDLILKIELSRFCQTLEVLLVSDVPILSAWDIAVESIATDKIQKSFRALGQQISRGSSLADIIRDNRFVPSFLTSIIEIGEESNSLDTALGRVAEAYRRQIETGIKLMSTVLEPVMILFVGLIIGFVIFAVLLPVFNINVGGI